MEGGFLSNLAEGQRIATSFFRQQLGSAIAQGIANYDAATNFRATATQTFAAARPTVPLHTRSITEPLADYAPDLSRRDTPSISDQRSANSPMDETPNRPIGVFDSGIGGLTVVKALRELLPDEDIFYVGDTARVPYGNKSAETVERYAIESWLTCSRARMRK